MKMFTKALPLVCLAAIAIAPAVSAATPVEEESFSIVLPDGFGKLDKQVQKNQKVTTYIAKSTDGGVVIVSYVLMAPTEDLQAFLSSERESLLKSLKATPGPQQALEIDGKEGISFQYEINGARQMFGRTDIVAADPRMYQVIYLAGTAEAVQGAAIEQMFGSFDLKEAELERVKTAALQAAAPAVAATDAPAPTETASNQEPQ